MADIAGLRQKLGEAEAAAANAEREYARLVAASKMANFNLPAQQQEFLAARQAATEFRTGVLEPAQADVSDAELALTNAERTLGSGPQQSTGQTTAEAQTANDDGANVQSPRPAAETVDAEGRVGPELATTVPTNADRVPVANEDSGTNARTRTYAETQSTPPATPGGSPVPGANAGVGSTEDQPQANAVRSRLTEIFGAAYARVLPQGNLLDKYASYTYSISLYMMSDRDYATLVKSKKKSIPGFQLLMQSGGIPLSRNNLTAIDPEEAQLAADGNSTAVQQPGLGRNQFFPLDYYIDNVRLRTLVAGKSTGGAHNSVRLTFKITEPNGISLIQNLWKAAQQYGILQGTNINDINYAAQNYLMVIRFYGYDDNGNLVPPGKSGEDAAGSDPLAIVEKFVPFQFTNIKFRIANRLTEYECEAICPQDLIASGTGRGVIPYNIEITSKTLKDLFVGNLVFTNQNSSNTEGRQPDPNQSEAETRRLNSAASASQQRSTTSSADPNQSAAETNRLNARANSAAPPKANAAPTPTITQGLCEALNKFQQERVKAGEYEYADEYRIIITEDIIANASVVPPGQTNKNNVPLTVPLTANEALNSSTQFVRTNAKTVAATAGMSIVQFIDLCTRTSTYVYDQQTKIKDPVTGELIPQGIPASVLGWYMITMESVPLKYDRKRNDYAYQITYTLSPYKINDLQSDYFPDVEFNGVHKQYNYWFTGENTQILKLEQDYNYLYYLVVNTGQTPQRTTGTTTNYREYYKKISQPNSPQSSQGQEGDVNEPSANAADYLYSPADQAKIKLEIIGDPSWIQQGSLWAGAPGLQFDYGPFLRDGTINFDGQQPLFEVAYNTPVDYDLGTGLMDAGQNNYGANRSAGQAGAATQSYIYQAIDVWNTFNQGRFTQELQGRLIQFPLDKKRQETKTEGRGRAISTPEVNQAAVRRVDNAIAAQPQTSPAKVDSAADTKTTLTWAQRQEAAAKKMQASRQSQQGSLFAIPTGPLNNTVPTSEGETVGPASSGSAAIRSQGGASGRDAGFPPSTTLTLRDGQTVPINSVQDIGNYGGAATANERLAAVRRLNQAQQAANNPTTSRQQQNGVKDP